MAQSTQIFYFTFGFVSLLSLQLSLLLITFLAATLLPLASELSVGALILAGQNPWLTLAVASFGNTAGSLVNWWLGGYLLKYQDANWFPVSREQLTRAQQHFQRFGVWSLLFAWLPLVGDPLTFAAGILRVRLAVFLLLAGTGKCARYAVIIFLIDA